VKNKFVVVEPEIENYVPIVYSDIIMALNKTRKSYSFYRLRKKLKKKRKKYLKYPVLSADVLQNAKLLVVYSPYATSHRAKSWSKQYKVPLLHLEDGFLPKSSLCDINGFWGDSNLKHSMSKVLDEYMDDICQEWSDDYRKYLFTNNISKRLQPPKRSEIESGFVFLPMQYMNDQSVIQFGNIPYPKFVNQVSKFCSDNGLVLAIKKHPHAYRKEPKNVDFLLRKMKKRYGKKAIRVVDGSIHWFCQNCKFMASMNTGAIVDGIVNGNIISHCGQSIFMNSGAVIHDDDVQEGLQKCMQVTNAELSEIHKRQKALLYYLYNHYLLLSDDTHHSKLSNVDKIINQIGQ